MPINKFSWQNPKPEKTACIVRYGGLGDLLQAAVVAPGLKDKGYHVTMMTDPVGQELLAGNPHIDEYIVQDRDQVPNEELGQYWSVWSGKFDLFVNLCEVIEGDLLALPGRPKHDWPLHARQAVLGKVNYYERMADMAGVPYEFGPTFYPTKAEREWADKQRKVFPSSARIVLFGLAGSSVHKAYQHAHVVVAELLRDPDVHIILTGDERCQLLEEAILMGALQALGAPEDLINQAIEKDGIVGLDNLLTQRFGQRRVLCASGRWSVRQTFTFLEQCDVVVGPETGVMSAAGFLPVAKVLLLSHSSPDNLCKHWKNTTALMAGSACQPCHRMHYSEQFCPQSAEFAGAVCMAELHPDAVVAAIRDRLPKILMTGTQ